MKSYREIEPGQLFRDVIHLQYIKLNETLAKNIDTGSIMQMLENELVIPITIDDIKE